MSLSGSRRTPSLCSRRPNDKVRTFTDDEIGGAPEVRRPTRDRDRQRPALQTEQAARARHPRRAPRVLHEIDQAIIAGQPLEEIAEAALRRLRNLLDVPRAIVNMFDLAAGEVEWLAGAGRRRVQAAPACAFPRADGRLEALGRGEPQVIDVATLAASEARDALVIGRGAHVHGGAR